MIGRLDTSWSVDTLIRVVTKWARAYDNRLISKIGFTTFHRQDGFVATFRVARSTLQIRKLWLVGGCRDRPSRALPLTSPNVNNL